MYQEKREEAGGGILYVPYSAVKALQYLLLTTTRSLFVTN